MEKIFITSGDYNGIGPEIVIKSLNEMEKIEDQYIILGSPEIIDFYNNTPGITPLEYSVIDDIGMLDKPGIYIYPLQGVTIDIKPGMITKEAGHTSGVSITKGVEFAKKYSGAIVTPPINKESLHKGGFYYPGHTEFIADLLDEPTQLMILDGKIIRVALVTTHLPLQDVSGKLTIDGIVSKGETLFNSLKKDYGIENPTIGICSLNPHASDGGLFGDQEEKIIIPATERLKKITKGNYLGPLPSDTMFTQTFLKKVDAYLVMYHDQGLIPLKLLTFGTGINFTAGLSIVRTSPDHGTAFDIAGKGVADHQSMKNSFEAAQLFVRNRKR